MANERIHVFGTPGIKKTLRGIPLVITEDHNEVFYDWRESGIKNATLIHIDGHSDMDTVAVPEECISNFLPNYWGYFTVSGFICPAVHLGIVSDIYWINPHSEKRKIQDMGSTDSTLEKRLLKTVVSEGLTPGLRCISWDEKMGEEMGFEEKRGEVISPEKLSLREDHPLILDIDYDAFCGYDVEHVAGDYDGVSGYQRRMRETFLLLKGLKTKPNLITLARSKGGKRISAFRARQDLDEEGHTKSYVPEEYAPMIERSLLRGLREVYK